jgi:hypothetical protein
MVNTPDTLFVTGYEFQQLRADQIYITPTGGSQTTLANALASAGGDGLPYIQTNTGGSITLGGNAQQAIGANMRRTGVTIQNLSMGDLYMNGGGTAAADNTSEWVPPGSENVFGALVSAISIYGATTGQQYVVIEKTAA